MRIKDQLWKMAQERAKRTYEEEYGSWEDADRYEREDWVFSEYVKLKEGLGIKEYKVKIIVSNADEEDYFEFYVEANSLEEAIDGIMDELDM